MGGAAQAGLNPAEDHRPLSPRLFAALGINQRRAIRALTGHVIRRISIVMAQLTIGGVAVDHRIHIPGCDAEKEVRFAEAHKVRFAAPVRLGDDTDAKALRFQHAPADRHTEARVIDIGVAGNEDNVAAVPAECIHLFARHRQKWRGAEAGRPVLRPGEKIAIRLDQGECAHRASRKGKKGVKGRRLYALFVWE